MAGKRTMLRTLLFFYVFLRRRLGGPLSPHRSYPHSQRLFMQKPEKLGGGHRAVVCSVEGGLLRSSSTFPYFMLLSLEAGGVVRALLLLLLYPLLCCVNEEVGLKVMTMVCFRGIKERDFKLGRSVLPKHMLEDVGLEGFQLLAGGGGKKVCVTGMPRVMVEASLKEHLGVDVVVGRELKVVGGHYTGIMEEDSKGEREAVRELFGKEGDGDGVLWVGGCNESHHLQHPFFSKYCKEMYTVSEADKKGWHPLPRDSYLKPLVFHDGRIAFRPTPAATLAMFLWLPLGLPLAILRTMVMFWLPYNLCILIVAFTGMTNRLVIRPPFTPTSDGRPGRQRRGRLYACNHRTLLDPVYVSGALGRPVTAVVYSVSPVAEVLSPIKTVRLTRDREEDRRRMELELRRGDVVVCPEGTTCREPYLLRFSRLFAEVAEEGVVPVALRVRMAMFYGTTAGGRKWMDPVLFAMDPFPSYDVEFLDEVKVVRADGTRRSSHEVANQVQGEIAGALGYECTMLTRRDKYLMLAGNEGFVN